MAETTDRMIEVRCCMCSWNGKILEKELDEQCPGCHEWECLYELETPK